MICLIWSGVTACTRLDVVFCSNLIIRSILCPCSPGLTAGARLRFAPAARTYKMVLSLEQGIASSLSPNINTKYSLNVQACETTFKHFLRLQQNVFPFPFNKYSSSYIYSANHVPLQHTQPFTAFLTSTLFLLGPLLRAFSQVGRMPLGVRRIKVGKWDCEYSTINIDDKRKPIQGCWVRPNPRSAPKHDRHESRSKKSSSYGDDTSTTSRHARTRRAESVNQGNGSGDDDDDDEEEEEEEELPDSLLASSPSLSAVRYATEECRCTYTC